MSDRLVFINFAGQAIRESPILGVGVGNFPWKSSYYLQSTEFDLLGDNVHNIYLSVWAELGSIGLIFYGTALMTGLGAIVRELWARPDPAGIAILGGVGGTAGDWAAGPLSLLAHPVPDGAVGLADGE